MILGIVGKIVNGSSRFANGEYTGVDSGFWVINRYLLVFGGPFGAKNQVIFGVCEIKGLLVNALWKKISFEVTNISGHYYVYLGVWGDFRAPTICTAPISLLRLANAIIS